MARRSGAGIYLLAGVGIAFILILVLLLASVHELPLSPAHLNILGHELTEEVQSPQVLYSTTLSMQPGQVYQITYDSNGIHIEQRSSQLIERLNLSNVDLSVNDVISAHLYDLYVPQCGNGCAHVKYYDVFTSTPQSGWVYFYAKLLNYWESLIVPMVFPGIRAPMKYGGLLRFGVSYGNSTVHSWVVSPTNLNGKFGDWHLYAINYNANGYTTYVDDLSTAIDTVSRPSTLAASVYSGNENVMLGGDDASPNGYGWIAFMAYSTSSADIQRHILPSASRLFDPTFYNGSAYFELVKGTVGIPTGVVRVPASQTWLWLVKGVTSDNYLHVRYVPPGSILRIKYNGMVYEFRINGEPNPAGLIEDYKIDLAGIFGSTVLPNATVELVYPSQKVRFYVPSGFQVVIEGSGWSETHEVPLSSSYVDFGLPSSGSYTVEVLGYREQPRVHIETSADGKVRITVTDEAGYALAGAKVYVFDGSNLAATGYTNDLGIYEFNKTLLSGDQARIVVTALKNGTYYHLDKVVSLSSNVDIEPQPRQPVQEVASATENSHSGTGLAIIIVVLLAGIALLLLGRGKRRAYIIPLLLLLLFPLVASYAHAEQIYLQWRDTGYDLAPGYRHTISLHVSYTNYPFYHSAGKAMVQAGPLKIVLEPHSNWFWGFTYSFDIYINGEREYHESIGAGGTGSNSIDRVVQVEVDCNGNALVYYDGQQVGSFTINGNTDILRNTENGGRVTVTATRLYNCNSDNSGGSDGEATPTPPPGPNNPSHYLDSISHALGTAATAGLLFLVLGGVGLALLIGYKQAKKHKLLALLPLLLLFFLPVAAHAETIHIKWSDPWHVQEISIVSHQPGSDNPHGRYMARYYFSPTSRQEMRFSNEAWVPAGAYIIQFLDEGSYLWLLQGRAWGHTNGYCWWMKIRLRTIPPSTLSITIENATRIGTSNMYAAFAVLSYYREPQPLSCIGSSELTVLTSNGEATLISMSSGGIDQASLIVCGPPRGHLHFTYNVDVWGRHYNTYEYEGDLVLPDAPAPSSNPNGSNNSGGSTTTTTPSNNNNSSNSSSNNNNNGGSGSASTQPSIDWSSFQEKLSNALGSLRGAIESPSHAMLFLVIVLLAIIAIILLLRG